MGSWEDGKMGRLVTPTLRMYSVMHPRQYTCPHGRHMGVDFSSLPGSALGNVRWSGRRRGALLLSESSAGTSTVLASASSVGSVAVFSAPLLGLPWFPSSEGGCGKSSMQMGHEVEA
eukprot:1194581-Prorocentrum_minimum.AAC.7